MVPGIAVHGSKPPAAPIGGDQQKTSVPKAEEKKEAAAAPSPEDAKAQKAERAM